MDSGASVINNKPVAWIDPYDLERLPHHDCWVNGQEHKNSVPLYTHPVKEHDIGISHAIGFDDGFKAGMQRAVEMNVVKELTDAEIDSLIAEVAEKPTDEDLYDFARAILKKARQ